MRSVVGGDGVDGAIGQGRLDGVDVRRRTQRRVDLEDGVVRGHALVGQREVVRRRFCRDRQLGSLGRPHHDDRHRRREVQEVHWGAGELSQGHVARHHHRFRLGRDAGDAEAARPVTFVHVAAFGQVDVLTVLGEGDAEGRGVLEGPAHEPGVLDAGAVVSEQAHAEGRHLGKGRQLPSGPGLGDGSRHPDVAAGSGGEVEHLPDGGGRVDGGLGVGHGHDGGEASEGRGPGPGLDGLGLLPPGLAQVDVQVDEPGGDKAAPRVQGARPLGLETLGHRGRGVRLRPQGARRARPSGRRRRWRPGG